MTESLTTGDLLKAKIVTSDDVSAAVDAYMAGDPGNEYVLKDEYVLDLRMAVRANGWASDVLKDDRATEYLKRAAVRTAILQARPEKR